MATLSTTVPTYIRCIKSNHEKQAFKFNAPECLRQLKYAGMIETVRIRQQGYAMRQVVHAVSSVCARMYINYLKPQEKESFFRRFKMLEPEAADAAELVERLSRSLQLGDKQWQVGTTKVFMKKGLSEKLQGLVKTRVRAAIRTAQVKFEHLFGWL